MRLNAPASVPVNYGRDISRGIISRQKLGRDRDGHPYFLTNRNRDQVGQPDLSRSSDQVRIPYPEFSSIFPGLFRSKKLGKVRIYPIFPDFS